VRLQLHVLAPQHRDPLLTLALPKEIEQLSPNLRRLLKISARIVRHGRYVVFQLTEVLFAKILCRLDGLRLRSPPFPA
jgi:hypothetical protein